MILASKHLPHKKTNYTAEIDNLNSF